MLCVGGFRLMNSIIFPFLHHSFIVDNFDKFPHHTANLLETLFLLCLVFSFFSFFSFSIYRCLFFSQLFRIEMLERQTGVLCSCSQFELLGHSSPTQNREALRVVLPCSAVIFTCESCLCVRPRHRQSKEIIDPSAIIIIWTNTTVIILRWSTFRSKFRRIFHFYAYTKIVSIKCRHLNFRRGCGARSRAHQFCILNLIKVSDCTNIVNRRHIRFV